jgi:hypothetical protein
MSVNCDVRIIGVLHLVQLLEVKTRKHDVRFEVSTTVTMKSGMEWNLRLTVSRPVCLGVGPPFGAHDQILHVL